MEETHEISVKMFLTFGLVGNNLHIITKFIVHPTRSCLDFELEHFLSNIYAFAHTLYASQLTGT